MFKFGRPYVFLSDSIIHDFVERNFVTGQTYASGMTMNYMISVDLAVPGEFTPRVNVVDRYAYKFVNPNYYTMISHTTRWEDEL